MAVYEQGYRVWTGTHTPLSLRFLVIPKYAFKTVFSGRAFNRFYIMCFFYPLLCLGLVYLWHNLDFLANLNIPLMDLPGIDNKFFFAFLNVQGFLGFIITIIVGPSLISPELTNNAIPLYLSRPFSRLDYIIGKMLVPVILISLITWVPGFIIYLFHCMLSDTPLFLKNIRLLGGLFAGSWMLILLLSISILTVSVYVRKKHAARGAYIGLIWAMSGLGEAINQISGTAYGSLIKGPAMLIMAYGDLFDVKISRSPGPIIYAALGGIFLVCFFFLYRKIRAVEVVK